MNIKDNLSDRKICKGIMLSLLALFSLTITQASAMQIPKDTIPLTIEFNGTPDSRINMTPFVKEFLKNCENSEELIVVKFPKGRYDFWPHHSTEMVYFESNTTDNNPKRCAVFLQNRKNIIIDGQGSEFIFHDRIQPFTLDNCNNITLKNISIDWDIPFTAQAEVVSVADDYIDIKINEKESPFEIQNGKLYFLGEGWRSNWRDVMEFDRQTKNVTPGTGGNPCLGRNWREYQAKILNSSEVRLYNDFERKPAIGNFLILRHSERDHAGIFVLDSKDIFFENVNIFNTAGLGILSQYSENLVFKKVQAIPNSAKGRYFSGHDDGLHFSGCKGQITVDSCVFKGLMDDPINVHGTNVKVIEKKSSFKLRCRFVHHQSVGLEWARSGEKVGFIDNLSMQTIGYGVVSEIKKINESEFDVIFKSPVPKELVIGNALENLSWVADVEIINSYFGGTRARGILVSTPGKVVIKNNIFESSGSAILIAGDANHWYESGAVSDVLIKNNIFLEGCLTSTYQFCEAIISIYPEVPEINDGLPAFHKNIRIEGNIFHPYDYPVLFAQSVDGLIFKDNRLIRSNTYEPFHKRKAGITLNACYNVAISGNAFEGDVLGKDVLLKNMPESNVTIEYPSNYRIKIE